MKIVMWIGNAPNQKALTNKVNNLFPLSGIVYETRKVKKNINFKTLLEKVIEIFFLSSIKNAWIGMNNKCNFDYPGFPKCELLNVENINSNEAYDFTKKIDADLILVSGTRLIKEKLLKINPSIGILNLHTGLSPYIKGGPNCTNWCLSTKQFELIGNTVMWIDLGIDTGNILTTERVKFTGEESLADIHIKVMDQAHELYLRSVTSVIEGRRQSVKQKSISEGITYYTRDWGLREKILLVKNLKYFRKINHTNKGIINVVNLPGGKY